MKLSVSNRVVTMLRDVARKEGPGYKLPTTRDLSRKYSTSLTTIADALDELEAQKIIVRQQGSGIYVAPTVNQRSVAVLLTSTHFAATDMSPFWPLIWTCLNHALTKRSVTHNERYLQHLMTPTSESGDYALDGLRDMLIRNDIQYVLSLGIEAINGSDMNNWLANSKTQVISFSGTSHRSVLMVKHDIIQKGLPILRAEGCQKVELWRNYPQNGIDDCVWDDEAELFYRTALQCGYSHSQVKIRDLRSEIDHYQLKPVPSNLDQGFVLAKKAFTKVIDRPDGLIITDDLATSGAIAAMAGFGLLARRDVKIATLANKGSHILYGNEENIIQFMYDPMEFVEGMLKQLDACIDNKPVTDDRYVFVSPTVVRYSPRSSDLLSMASNLIL